MLAGAGAGAGLFFLGLGGLGPGAQAAPLDLDVFAKGFPRAFFFRRPEGDAASGQLTYEEWESRYLPLGGICGKVLNEEHDRSGGNLPFFVQYKERNPSKMVLLHYNGTGRRATDEATTRFFSGHWLYYKGTTLTQPLEADSLANVVHVEDTSVFSLARYKKDEVWIKDDVVIAAVGDDGKPRWEEAEHLRLQTIDVENNTITVERGAYGTQALSFSVGSYLAAHVMTGPFREDGLPLWSYNFSTECPRDGQGRNCAEVLVDYLAEKLGPSGELSSFDGITLDVFTFTLRGYPRKDIDVNTDGIGDGGIVGGLDTFSFGSLEFLEELRNLLGPEKLILSDGQSNKSQRGFGYLNGVESEGYSDLYDIELDHLSRGENIFDYWKKNSAPPSLNYVNFKYKQKNPTRWRNTFVEPNLSEDRSYEKLRLVLASALFTDSVFAYGWGVEFMPPQVTWKANGARVRVFDELWKGTEQIQHWLGQPLGPAVHLAEKAPDLFEGRGESWTDAFIGRFGGEGVSFSREGTETEPILVIRNTLSRRSPGMSFTLSGIEVPGKDLFVSLRLRAEPLEDFPSSVPRRVDVSAIPAGKGITQPNREFTWAGEKPFEASFYYQDVGPGTVHLRFEVEGEEPLYFERIAAHSAADGRYREFENGVVFANPSTRSYTFDVDALFPGVTLRRIQGSERQDPATNDNTLLGQQLTLPAKDGLFVEKV